MLARVYASVWMVMALLGLTACGGGGSGGSNGGAGTASGWTTGIFQPSSSFAAKCVSPRSGFDSVTGHAYADVSGTLLDENNWLRSWTNELYLWYSEVPDVNPANYTSTASYFDVLKTPALTASGHPKDKFHFTYVTSDWEALETSNVSAGYGLQWEIIQATSTAAPQVYVAYLEPGLGTPALQASLTRGAQVQAVDGVNLASLVTQSQADTVNAGLFPSSVGESHTFQISDAGGTRTVSMQSIRQSSASVMNVKSIDTGAGIVGYIQFNDHQSTAEQELIDAINTLNAAGNGSGVVDLVLDMRYNGGGLLDIASELAYMIAGPALTSGQTFDKIQFNDKYPNTDPVTGQPLTPTPFLTSAQGFSAPQGQALPTLNLSRVFILTGAGTCSASEAVMNGLRGVGVQVIQIGSTTCGKPYGFYPQDNCGTTYFSIEFQGVNAQNFGNYPDGFSPNNITSNAGFPIPGCSVADDFSHALGDPSEGRLAAALGYRAGASCPAATGFAPDTQIHVQSRPVSDAAKGVHRPFWRENLILPRR